MKKHRNNVTHSSNDVKSMLGMDCLEDLVKLAIWSGKVAGERPVSLIIIAPPESGKTQLIKKFSDTPGVCYFSDLTLSGLYELLPEIEGGRIHHLLIADLLKLVSRKRETVNNLITALNNVIEDEYISIKIYGWNREYRGLRCGFIGGITPSEFQDRRRKWHNLGFLSRALPVSWSFHKSLIDAIYTFNAEGRYRGFAVKSLDLPEAPVEVHLPSDLAKELILDAKIVAAAEGCYGFRLQKQLNALAKASALSEGRTTVTDHDILRVKELVVYMNFNLKPIGLTPDGRAIRYVRPQP